MSPSVLLVEDETNLADAVRLNLEREGFDVRMANDGVGGLAEARRETPDIIVLDIMLPDLNGLEVCRALRRESDVPILMLTALGEEVDKVVGLELGADDYVTKPFSMRELLARVRAILRRPRNAAGPASPDEMLRSGNLEIDLAAHVVRLDGEAIPMRPREFALLALLVKNPRRVYTRNQILEALWGHDYIGDERTVDVHIRWLREKLEEKPSDPTRIVTLRGIGYRFEG
jgi:DNA-binding response OmpR family regulator